MHEVAQQSQACFLAFFRMKLDGENIIPCYGASKRKRIKTVSRRRFRTGGFDIVTVHEIEPRILRDTLPQGMPDNLMHLVPAHVRHFEPELLMLAGFVDLSRTHYRCRGKAPHCARYNAQAGDVAFLTTIEQHLQ